MVSIHNYGIRHRYKSPAQAEEARPGQAGRHPDEPYHWSSDDPAEDEDPGPSRRPGSEGTRPPKKIPASS